MQIVEWLNEVSLADLFSGELQYSPEIGEEEVRPSELKYLRRNKNSRKQKFGPPPKRC